MMRCEVVESLETVDRGYNQVESNVPAFAAG